MKALHHWTAGSLAVGGLLALILAQPDLKGQLGMGGRAEAGALLVSAPDERALVASKRLDRKEKVIDRLLAGEMTLTQAGAWFRHLNDNPPEARQDFRRTSPGDSDGEKACRQVITWVDARLRGHVPDSQADARVRCLRDELDAARGPGGTVELPW